MSPRTTKQLTPRALVDDFGSRSAVAQPFCSAEAPPSADATPTLIEDYFATVVRSTVEHVLGDAARAMSDDSDSEAAARHPFDHSPPTDELSSEIRRRMTDYDTSVSDGEPPPAVDWFGPLYQDLFPRSLRHALGEYYTPDWLAEHVLDSVGYLASTPEETTDDAPKLRVPRLLDPTCGSGVFLLAAIRRVRAAAERQTPPADLARRILDGIAGFDVNRLAVLTSRANYLLAMRDLLPAALPCPAPPIHLRDVILDRPEPGESFDAIVGNPPWVAWDNLSNEYRELTKPLWRDYGLFSLTGAQARHGGGKKDLAMLVLYAAADRYLRDGGRLGFVITQTLFQTKGAGDGFRRFRLGDAGPPLKVLRVDDMAQFQPFAGAANWTATIALEKGRETVYPIRYAKWRRGHPSPEIAVECLARPIDAARPRSPWILLPAAMKRDLSELTGPSDYTANLGANSGGANGVYWVEILNATGVTPGATAANPAATGVSPVPDTAGNSSTTGCDEGRIVAFRSAKVASPRGSRSTTPAVDKHGQNAGDIQRELFDGDAQPDERCFRGAKSNREARSGSCVVVRNLAGVGKRAVAQTEAPIEAELLFPLVRWGDLGRWRAVPRCHLLLVQDVATRSGIDAATMQQSRPAAFDYLLRFRDLLEQRAAYRRYQSAGPFWSMYNVGPYTLAPTKVVWRRMDRRINAAVVEPIDHPLLGVRPVIVQETCVQVAVDSSDEAHYLAAVLNSMVVNFLVAAHSVGGGKGFGTPSMLDYLNIRRFNPTDSRHRALADLSREAHRRSAVDQPALDMQREIDCVTGELLGLSDEELVGIKKHLDMLG